MRRPTRTTLIDRCEAAIRDENRRRAQSNCSFCRGLPVGNAREWVTGKPEPRVACPRCGKIAPRQMTDREKIEMVLDVREGLIR